MTTAVLNSVLGDACQIAGLNPSGHTPLRQHANAIYLLPSENVVARLTHGLANLERVRTAIAITRWLITQGFPATAPHDAEQPLVVGDHVVTFWTYYPQGDVPPPSPADLGRLLRQLHSLPPPPVALPRYEPLKSFSDTVLASTTLADDDRQWLLSRGHHLLNDYGHLHFPLGIGHIHGDAYPGNTLWANDQPLLGDWDETGTGPRELDLANTYQGVRFGRTRRQLDEFAHAYNYDFTTSPGFQTLCDMRDLHTLGSYIRLADTGHPEATRQLAYRLMTLKKGDRSARWDAR